MNVVLSGDDGIFICIHWEHKGCIHGSDAHSNEKVFEPDQKWYCRVKGDPTFNGLKQIVYDPKARIRISSVKPEEKLAYQVIDSGEKK